MALAEDTLDGALLVARQAAHEASVYLKGALRHTRSIHHKGALDLVTEHDLRSEETIRRALLAAFPSFGLLCEEGGTVGPSDPRWIVDPLDGTTNFAHGLPIFAIAIALEHEGAIELAVVDAPALGSVWTARRGRGATRNDEPVHVSSVSSLDQALLATGFPYDLRTSRENNFAEFERMQLRVQAVRRCGAAVLDLAWLADGTFDAYWESKLQPWDWATGSLLVTEAGGRVTGAGGGPFSPFDHTMVASNGLLHDAVLAALAERP